MTERELLEAIFKEVKEQRDELKEQREELKGQSEELKGQREQLREQREDLKGQRVDIKRLENKLDAQNDILRSFKFDIDYIVEKQAKQELKVNRLSKQFEA
jgi:chromosome segregation ATPase